jgi:hypothetical protein
MEDMEFLKALLAEMNAEMDATQERWTPLLKQCKKGWMEARMKETMERQIGSLVSIMEADRETDRDEMKQEVSAGHACRR